MATPDFTVTIQYPTQTVFTCPVCDVNYSIYPSWTRHLTTHPDASITTSFRCSDCDCEFASRRSVSIHHSKSHGAAAPVDRTLNSGDYQCEFCENHYPSKRSLSQHIHNQHAAAASEQRDLQASQATSRLWTPSEHSLFLDALQKHGPSSNVPIARVIGTKSAKQVGVHKRIFLRDHPDWLEQRQNQY